MFSHNGHYGVSCVIAKQWKDCITAQCGLIPAGEGAEFRIFFILEILF